MIVGGIVLYFIYYINRGKLVHSQYGLNNYVNVRSRARWHSVGPAMEWY